MFIYNISLAKNKKNKTTFFLFSILVMVTAIIFICSMINNNRIYVQDTSAVPETTEIPASDYTNILNDCYANLSKYVGKKIKFSGFVCKIYDFKENQFVLGREMILNSNPSLQASFSSTTNQNVQAQVVIVGFMCETNNAVNFADNTWVEVEGTITRGFYHSEIPIVKVSNIKETNCPDFPYVYPPDGGYTMTE